MMISQMEGEDASEGNRLIYPNMSENDVILLNTEWRFPLPGLKIKNITQANLLRRASTHNLFPKVVLKVKVKDKFKRFYFKLVPFVSS